VAPHDPDAVVDPPPADPAPAPGMTGSAAASWKHWLGQAALIAAVALAINLAGNGSRGLWDRDEPRYAGCAREMRQSGDLIYPTFNAEPRFHKPILVYWLMLAAIEVFGDNPFGARVVSALAGTAVCLVVWGLGRRMIGPRAGLLAALALATAPLMAFNAKIATTDATLLLWLVLCLFALWELGKVPSRFWAGVFWVALSLATLTKGPIGPATLIAAGAFAWWWGVPLDALKRLRWRWGVPGFVLLTAPWFVAIGILSNGDFFRVSMGYHVVRRMTTGIETHGGFPGYYVVGTLLTCYPWSALLPAGLLAAWSRRKGHPELAFLLGWIVGPLVMLELVQTKLIHYYLPAIPGCALLAAWTVEAVAQSEVNLRRWALGRLSLGLMAGIGIALTVGLLAGALVFPGGLRAPSAVTAMLLGAGTLYALERFQAGATHRAATGLVATWGVVLLVVGAWLLPAVDPYRISPMVARRLAEISAREQAAPVLTGFKAPAVVYELGRPIPVVGDRVELKSRLRADGAVVTALTAEELAWLKKDAELALDVRDPVQGLDIENPLRDDPLYMVVIRSAPALATRPGGRSL